LAEYDLRGKRVWVAGHRGMAGSAIVRRLREEGCEILEAPRDAVDLRRQEVVERWMAENRPQAVVVAAAKVGGILANKSFPAQFLYDNLMIEANVVHAAHAFGVGKLLFLASACVYPRSAEQPFHEEQLLTGSLEPDNQWYAVAKIAGIKLCQAYRRQYGDDFISVVPTNLYGPGDNFELANSHVMAALIRKAMAARDNGDEAMVLWGSGMPRREFLHVDDLADACAFLLRHYSDEAPVNAASGQEITIRELAEMVNDVVGFRGRLTLDPTKPEGSARMRLDTSRLTALGWRAKVELRDGIAATYRWLVDNRDTARFR
jgi:GDP-L-fucose synthase